MITTQVLTLGYLGSIKNLNGKPEDALSLFDINNTTEATDVDMTRSHTKFKKNLDVFYVFEGNGIWSFYKLLPNTKDDETFKWQDITSRWRHNKERAWWAKVDLGFVYFGVTYHPESNDVCIAEYIDGKFIKQFRMDNTIITNETIKKEIDEIKDNLCYAINHCLGGKEVA